MSNRLTPALQRLLDEVITKHGIDQQFGAAVAGSRELFNDESERLMDALAFELTETGLSENDEPNVRGLQLEELIDFHAARRRDQNSGWARGQV